MYIIKYCTSFIFPVTLSTWCVCCTGNIPTAVLQEETDMTISQELVKSTHSSANISTGKRETEEEPEEDANEGRERQKRDMEMQEKNENLLERMMSWVELDNERQSEAEMTAAEGVGKVGDAAAQRVLLEAEGRLLGDTDRDQTHSVEEELAMMEEKWREQCVINETLKQRLADEEERFRVRKTGRSFALTLGRLK